MQEIIVFEDSRQRIIPLVVSFWVEHNRISKYFTKEIGRFEVGKNEKVLNVLCYTKARWEPLVQLLLEETFVREIVGPNPRTVDIF